jgi:restriction system protein
MAIPDYQTRLLHLFRLASDGAEHTLRNAVPALADIFRLTDAERTELLPSGQEAVFHNRVAWANTYLKKAELLRAPRRGAFTITDRGKSVLAKNPPKVDLKHLEQFRNFWRSKPSRGRWQKLIMFSRRHQSQLKLRLNHLKPLTQKSVER